MKQSGSTPGGKSGLCAKPATLSVAQRSEWVTLAFPWAERLAMKHSCPNAVLVITRTAAAASATDAKNRLVMEIPPVRPRGATSFVLHRRLCAVFDLPPSGWPLPFKVDECGRTG